MKLTTTALLLICFFIACKNQNSDTNIADTTITATPPMDSSVTDAGSSLGNYPVSSEPTMGTYDTITNAFKGNPKVDNVKQLIDTVLKQCNMEVTRDNVVHFANELVEKRKESKAGVTEMDLLKEMNRPGVSGDLDTRLGTSATRLEQKK
jgi:hypothetical protein